MAGYCTLVLYFHSLAAHENTGTHSCNIQPYCLLNHQVYTTSICTCKYCKYANIHLIQARVQCAGNSDSLCYKHVKTSTVHKIYNL